MELRPPAPLAVIMAAMGPFLTLKTRRSLPGPPTRLMVLMLSLRKSQTMPLMLTR